VVGNAVPISNSDARLRRGQERFWPVHPLYGKVYVAKYDGLGYTFPMTEIDFLSLCSVCPNEYILAQNHQFLSTQKSIPKFVSDI
jgi:hypothetical protein